MTQAFGFEGYIRSIASQISANFRKIDRLSDECKALKNSDAQAFLKSSKLLECAHKDSYYRNISSLSVGIFGEWGSGKTKLLKGIEDHFHKQGDTIIPIFFNAWRYEKDEHIIIPLFKTLLQEIKQLHEKEKENTRFENILKDVRILTFSLLSGFGAEGFGLKFSANDAISRLFEMKKGEKIDDLELMERIESVYFNLPQKIEAITLTHDVRFVFLIDDLDRCLPENTLKMLESIKLFLDIPGCAFVMAIDDDIVERGVEHHYRNYLTQEIHINTDESVTSTKDKSKEAVKNIPITGSEYLEKMIQIPFSLPILPDHEIRIFLLDSYPSIFQQTLKQEQTKELKEQEVKIDEAFLTLFIKIIPPVPRKMIRTIELFKVKDDLINIPKETLLKLIALELFAPTLFRLAKQKFPKNILEAFQSWVTDKRGIYDFVKIDEEIIQKTSAESVKRRYQDMLHALKKEDISRVKFNLEYIFTTPISKDDIERYLHMTDKLNSSSFKPNKLPPLATHKLDQLINGLKEENPQSWKIALEELEGDILSSEDITKIKDSDITITNRWLETIKSYVDSDDFIRLLLASDLLKEIKA